MCSNLDKAWRRWPALQASMGLWRDVWKEKSGAYVAWPTFWFYVFFFLFGSFGGLLGPVVLVILGWFDWRPVRFFAWSFPFCRVGVGRKGAGKSAELFHWVFQNGEMVDSLPETNIAPEKRPSQKESSPYSKHQFSRAMLVSGRVVDWLGGWTVWFPTNAFCINRESRFARLRDSHSDLSNGW